MRRAASKKGVIVSRRGEANSKQVAHTTLLVSDEEEARAKAIGRLGASPVFRPLQILRGEKVVFSGLPLAGSPPRRPGKRLTDVR